MVYGWTTGIPASLNDLSLGFKPGLRLSAPSRHGAQVAAPSDYFRCVCSVTSVAGSPSTGGAAGRMTTGAARVSTLAVTSFSAAPHEPNWATRIEARRHKPE